ncbi:MAG TPA: tRNA 2-thiouridine(34) synthase MnmA [Acidiferrobacter sp.]|nr:tRNA 2-thiouridine(34) synthase MnmA [Acidiferrobacter sp.]
MKTHVVVALSGGVDSAVAAALLQAEGYRVSALFMKNWEDDDTETYCSSAADHESAQMIADRLKIPLHAVNFAAEYRARVFTRFLDDCAAGLTPNPDVLCNREIKFDVFWHYAQQLGADVMATGHYARIADQGNGLRLLTGRDANKDQTYFLHTIDSGILRYTRFPIGVFHKDEVRARARALGLPNAERKGSSGICFIGERHFRPFLQQYLDGVRGPIYTIDGEHKGDHEGLMFYTIGQRQGLGIGGPGEAWYVAEKRRQDNALIIVQGADHPGLYKAECRTLDPYWLGPAPALPWSGHAKIRYRQTAEPCQIEPLADGGLRVRFPKPQRAVTPGQSVVFYNGPVCLGGAVIADA